MGCRDDGYQGAYSEVRARRYLYQMRPYTEEPGAEKFACPVLDWRRGGRTLRRPYEKFAVIPAKEGDVHRPLLSEEKGHADHIFSIHDTRRINLDFTIQFKNNWYQLTEIQPTTIRPLMIVLMETWLDQSVHILFKGHELAFIVLPEKPKKQRIKQPIILTTHTLNYKPPPNHPWRRYPAK